MRRASTAACLVLIACSCTSAGHALDWLRPMPAYPLDGVSRSVVAGEKLACQRGELELVSYTGEVVRYERPVRVHPAFVASLSRFERIVDEVARAHFGRPPRRIVHLGAYSCRAMRRRTHLVSEHALGNAIDVAGFDFGPLPRKAPVKEGLPKALRRAFQVRIDKHWKSTDPRAAESSLFLHDLAERIIERPDVFRALVGPGFAGHHNHFHLANPPYRMVKLDEVQRWSW